LPILVSDPVRADTLGFLLSDPAVLQAVLDLASGSVIVADSTLTIRYANAAAATATGYSVEELIGQTALVLRSDDHDDEFYESIWSRLTAGLLWKGVLVNRRKDGQRLEEAVTISPVLDEVGEFVAFVANKRDRTVELRLQDDISRRRSDRQEIVILMDHVQPGETIRETASAFCRATTELEGIHGAMVLLLQHDGTLTVVSAAGLCEPALALTRPLSGALVDDLVETTVVGPWFLDVADDAGYPTIGRELADSLRDVGVTTTGFVGIRCDGELAGLLGVGTSWTDGVAWLSSRRGTLEQLGSYAGTLMGYQAVEHVRRERLRSEVLHVMENRLYHPVFQPVVDTGSGAIVGYEALTRFDDGCRPDVRVSDAHLVGLGPIFEATLAASAVEAARHLPSDIWLGLNFSAEAILDGFASPVVVRANRAIVIEITEHARIDSYPDVRKAIIDSGDVLLSVDDAGAGFASLHHVLELDPDIVKLDIGLIRGIDADPARQALAAGLCHFAQRTGTTLIAEGVETQGEAETVRDLGVELAQGFLFGRPEPF
jgi:PAS domain S-box-containing protein